MEASSSNTGSGVGEPASEPAGEQEKKIWYLRQVDLFRGLSHAEIEALTANVAMRSYQPGAPVVGPGESHERIYVVKCGAVRLFHRGPDGREVTVELLGRGQLFGFSGLFGPGGDGLLAEAATEALLCYGQGWELLRLMARWPPVMLGLVRQVGAQVLHAQHRLHDVAAADARTRLAETLCQLAGQSGGDAPGGGRRIGSVLTHATLARQIGARRETVTRLLAGLEAEGFIRREGRQIVVVDPARLRASFDRAGLNR